MHALLFLRHSERSMGNEFAFYLPTLPSENVAPEVSWILLGTTFSIFSGKPSCTAFGTMLLPVACETLPVAGLEPVLWAASGILSSTEAGT